jgi:hypothetical protein
LREAIFFRPRQIDLDPLVERNLAILLEKEIHFNRITEAQK